MKKAVFILLACISYGCFGQSIIGKWKTIDDESGKIRSVVEIYERDGKVFGKVAQIVVEEGEEEDPVCDECDEGDPRYQQKVIGMEIIKDMVFEAKDKVYQDGNILDPENGSIYDGKLWLEDGKLRVRGYIMFLYRTQTWLPFEN
ncbi:MAG: hypothetical protein ACI9I8_001806 [Cellvibrionaceae bacterium]|jgi:uncharacterized protein (DUF2147 family)